MIEAPLSRDFTVAVFVLHRDHVVLHRHPKLGIWLPPGGHIEPNELPDEAALREVTEESGLTVELVGERGIGVDYPDEPRQLVRPEGIQLETIRPGHEHIDLIYFARPIAAGDTLPLLSDGMTWIAEGNLNQLALTSEVRDWCHRAFDAARTW